MAENLRDLLGDVDTIALDPGDALVLRTTGARTAVHIQAGDRLRAARIAERNDAAERIDTLSRGLRDDEAQQRALAAAHQEIGRLHMALRTREGGSTRR